VATALAQLVRRLTHGQSSDRPTHVRQVVRPIEFDDDHARAAERLADFTLGNALPSTMGNGYLRSANGVPCVVLSDDAMAAAMSAGPLKPQN